MNEPLNDITKKTNRINLKRTTPKHKNTSVKPSTYGTPKTRFDYYENSKNQKKETVFLYLSLFFCVFSGIFFFYEDNTLNGVYLLPYTGYLFIRVILYTALEVGILSFCQSFILNKILKINFSEGNKSLICFASFAGLVLLNAGLLEVLNIRLDRSKPIKRYVEITAKDKFTSIKHNTTRYYIYFRSWKKTFLSLDLRLNAYEDTFYRLDKKKIICLPTKKGFFGFDYIVNQRSIVNVDKELFPEGTQFPLTEEQALKLMKEKKEE